MEKETEENIGEGKRGKYLEKENREIFGEVFRVEGKGEKCLEKENILFPWTGRDIEGSFRGRRGSPFNI